MTDRTLLCGECGKDFVFTVAEQEFFRERGFDHEPKRCVDCRRNRRRKFKSRGPRERGPRGEESAATARLAEPRSAPERERPRPSPAEMHETTCSECDEPTLVPFVPDGVRPVFCMPCLKKQTR